MAMNPKQLYGWLNAFDFTPLFVEGMSWSQPPRRQAEVFEVGEALFEARGSPS